MKIRARRESTGRFAPGAPKGKHAGSGRSPERVVAEVTKQRQVLAMTNRGMSHSRIAELLGVDVRTVARLLSRAVEEYLVDHQEFMQREMAKMFAKYDAIDMVWWPRVVGGDVIDPVTGERSIARPDVEAFRVYRGYLRDKGQLLKHGVPIRVEHTGAAGGPIVTAEADAMETARLISEDFRARLQRGEGGPAATPIPDDGEPVH